MAAKKAAPEKKFFTPAQANAMLPLVGRIVADITRLAGELRERQALLQGLRPRKRGGVDESEREEIARAEADLESGGQRMREFLAELRQLGVELKDPVTGLIDFPWRKDGREVCLCWRLGEAEVGHWHEVDAGFAGRQKLLVPRGASL